jgi:hypothetical protein
MNRAQLEHVIRAASSIANDREIVVLGSQAILGRYPEAPPTLCVSLDVDLYPRNHPDRSDLVDGAIGELSAFHETFGYYAHGVGPETAVLPAGWESRLVRVEGPGTGGAVGLCLDPHDLAISKLVAGRDKDLEYLEVAAGSGLVDRDTLLGLIDVTPTDPGRRELARERIRGLFTSS